MHNAGGDVNSYTAVPVHAEMSGSMLLSWMLLPQGHTFGCLPPQVLTPVKQALSAYEVYQALAMAAHMSCCASFLMAQTASRWCFSLNGTQKQHTKLTVQTLSQAGRNAATYVMDRGRCSILHNQACF